MAADRDLPSLTFRAMGSEAHVIVQGAPALVDYARRRVDQLEQRWSRFLPTSEVSHLNAAAGTWLPVSADTRLLVARAIDAWRLSGGAVDATVLGAVLRAGYGATFDTLHPGGVAVANDLVLACTDIEIDEEQVRLPAGTGFDPGGIGKGLAADLVATELLAQGAEGACVNLGGDVRVAGTGPDGGGWTIAVEHPASAAPLALVGVVDGGVATSTTLLRRWTVDGRARHHLIDPASGEPSTTDLDTVSVVAAEAWLAEVHAKAGLLRGADRAFDLVEGTGIEGLAVTTGGTVLTTDRFDRFTGGHLVTTEARP